MLSQSRRKFLIGSAAALAPQLSLAQTPDTLQAWLASQAKPVRSVDPADEDFSDLEPLMGAIGSARVVQLGEPSHGAGTAFAAKARLCKFLHQRMGFDVLVWESGLYDVSLVQEGMRGADSGTAAARRGIFTLWSQAEEVRPLFEYVKASQSTARPFEMAGYDLQVTANGSAERFETDLRAFAGTPQSVAALPVAEEALAARRRLYATKFAKSSDFESLTNASEALLALIRNHRSAFEGAHGAEITAFMELCIGNMRIDALQRYDSARSETTPERESRRDARNAEIFRWLLENKYRGRKLIIWAHNAHVMNAYYEPGFKIARLEGRAIDMKPTGVHLREWLGMRLYTIGITAFEGHDGFAFATARSDVAPAPPESLEARLHALGHPYLFLNLRGARAINAPLSARIPKYDVATIAGLGHAYDAVFYIDRMAAATRLQEQAK